MVFTQKELIVNMLFNKDKLTKRVKKCRIAQKSLKES